MLVVSAAADMIKLFGRRAGQHRAAPDATALVVYVPSAWPPPARPVQHLTTAPVDPWINTAETIVTDGHAFWARMEQYR